MIKKIKKILILWFLFFILDLAPTDSLSIAEELSAATTKAQQQKLRILVDKVMQPEAKWVTKEWMVKEAAEAGFNVYTPRQGYDRLDEVERVAGWCRKYGIAYMPWMRGSLEAIGLLTNGKRYVSEEGREQSLFSPNSDDLWEWLSRYILAYAKMSMENKSLTGVFLDFENYAPEKVKGKNCYELSYDNVIMEKFAQAKGIKVPSLSFVERKAWLETQGLLKDFEDFQVSSWRERCADLRKKVDAINPKFRFCVYPFKTFFIEKAVYPSWTTAQSSLIVADHHTYSHPRSSGIEDALQKNRGKLLKRKGEAERLVSPLIFIGGIDPIAKPPSDPEFCGRNAKMIMENSDGYWVFYEGPKYNKDHPGYFQWFKWANNKVGR